LGAIADIVAIIDHSCIPQIPLWYNIGVIARG
jgi:hypothetical protein